MKRKSRFVILSLIPFFLLGCVSEIDFIESSLRPGGAESSFLEGDLALTFSSSAGTASVDLEATGKWTAAFVNDRAKDWCSLSSSGGKRGRATVTVSVLENPDYDQRSATIVFSSGDVNRSVVVTQKQKDAILVTSNRIDVGAAGGQVTVEVKANVEFGISISEEAKSWIKPLETRALSTSLLSFAVDANDSLEKREGTITITGSAGQEIVKVYQEGDSPRIVPGKNHYELSCEAQEISIDVRHNIDVTMEIPKGCSWVTESKTRSTSTSVFHLEIAENEAFSSRLCQLVFRSEALGLTEEVILEQQAATPQLFIGEWQYEFDSPGGELDIEVTSNYEVTVSVPDTCSWIGVSKTRSMKTRSFHFTIDPNDTFAERNGCILFLNDELGKKEVVQIRQKAETPTLIIGEHQYAFEPEGGMLQVDLASNMMLDVEITPSCDWLEEVTTRSVTERRHLFSVGKNHGRVDRNAWIVFKNESLDCSDTVFVSQGYRQILVSCDTLHAPSRGGIVSFETVGPEPSDYRVEFVDGWLSLAGQDKVAGHSRFRVSVEGQSDAAPSRNGRVLVFFTDYSEPDTVLVHQSEILPMFSFTSSSQDVTVPVIKGENQEGFVYWGDDTVEPYVPGLTHHYVSPGIHTVTIEIRSKKRVSFIGLENGMTINIKELRNK